LQLTDPPTEARLEIVETILLASPSPAVLDRMERQIPASLQSAATVSRIQPDEGFLELLRYEIPDLVVLHAAGDPAPWLALLAGLEADPWLDSVGLILVVDDVDEAVERFQGASVAYFLEESRLDRNLGRVILLLDEKRDFLNYDGIIKKITSLSGELRLDTDLLLVPYYSSLFSNYLFKEGLIDRRRKDAVQLALEELLTNAMEHGNAGLSFAEKTALTEAGRSLQDEVEDRMTRAPWKGRRVTLGYSIGPLASRFTIADEGEGFDPASVLPARMAAPGEAPLAHGRGILLARSGADALAYDEGGTSVTVTFGHNGRAERSIPAGFAGDEARAFLPGQVVFREHEVGDHLYYIVSGEYEVVVGGTPIAVLTPADVFMGEMSFLLGNRRTATVTALKAGRLVEISRQAFTEAVKRSPNYGIFLSKMLARRLRDNNRRFAG